MSSILANAGANAVVLIAAAALPDLPVLLDTCTLLGLEALVEVHTPDEVAVAAGCGAGILIVNERDRATGQLILGQASAYVCTCTHVHAQMHVAYQCTYACHVPGGRYGAAAATRCHLPRGGWDLTH